MKSDDEKFRRPQAPPSLPSKLSIKERITDLVICVSLAHSSCVLVGWFRGESLCSVWLVLGYGSFTGEARQLGYRPEALTSAAIYFPAPSERRGKAHESHSLGRRQQHPIHKTLSLSIHIST